MGWRNIIYRALQGRCGRFCGECEIYIAYTTSNKKSLSRIARERSKATGKKITSEDVKCLGCKASTSSCWNSDCYMRSCVDNKGLEFCYQCLQFPCDELLKLFEKHPEARENLKIISKIGPDAWVSSKFAGSGH